MKYGKIFLGPPNPPSKKEKKAKDENENEEKVAFDQGARRAMNLHFLYVYKTYERIGG